MLDGGRASEGQQRGRRAPEALTVAVLLLLHSRKAESRGPQPEGAMTDVGTPLPPDSWVGGGGKTTKRGTSQSHVADCRQRTE
jgi:hypothetical protein